MAKNISGFEGIGLSDVVNTTEYFSDLEITTDNFSAPANCSNANSSDYSCGNDDYYYYYFYVPTLLDTIVVATILGVVLFVGIVGNILVLILIAGVKSMQTTVNRCLFSLAVADLLILTFLPVSPFLSDFYGDTVPFGEHLCNFLNMLDRGACTCSILNFVFVTIERYIALCHPMKSRQVLTGTKTNVVLCVIWLVSLASACPYMYIGVYEIEVYDGTTYFYCYLTLDEDWEIWYDTAFCIMIIYLPMPILSVIYGKMIHQIRASVPKSGGDNPSDTVAGNRGRSRVVVMLLALVVIYAACQIPFATITFFSYFLPEVFSFSPYDKSVFEIAWGFRVLIYVNSIVNPILYFCMSTNFRRAFVILFCRCRKADKNAVSITSTTGVSIRK